MALQNFGNDTGVLQPVLEAFVAEMQGQVEHIQDAMQRESYPDIRNLAHRFEGAAAYVVASKISHSCRELKAACDAILHQEPGETNDHFPGGPKISKIANC